MDKLKSKEFYVTKNDQTIIANIFIFLTVSMELLINAATRQTLYKLNYYLPLNVMQIFRLCLLTF